MERSVTDELGLYACWRVYGSEMAVRRLSCFSRILYQGFRLVLLKALYKVVERNIHALQKRASRMAAG
jgi:hypothetical protein